VPAGPVADHHRPALPPGPEIAVAVASHERPLRLRWLLHALAEQTVAVERFEVVVAHDDAGEETQRLLEGHELARAGTLRHLRVAPGDGSIASLRNLAWRAARAPLVAFTDDDCRPPADWLERALAAAVARPGAVVQGATRPEPLERHGNGRAPWQRSQHIDPPTPWVQACNALYPRALLERVDGFAEDPVVLVGEDTDLAERARAAGAHVVGDPALLTFHAIEDASLPGRLRSLWRWRDLPLLFRRHPRLRSELLGRVFWRPSHLWLALALAAAGFGTRAAGGRRSRLVSGSITASALAAWGYERLPRYGGDVRGRLRALSELPAWAAVDLVETAALLRGSVRHRSPLL